MKKILIFACIASLMFSSCGDRTPANKSIIVPREEAWDNFSHPSLQRFITDNPGSSVVVRDPNINDPATNRVCTLIEAALMRRGFNPRDRRLFENSVAKLEDGSDYPKIREVTGTDLIFEVTSFRKELYEVTQYHDLRGPHPFELDMGKKQPKLYPEYILTGFSIEIKVILLNDNLIAGTYKYYQTPCTEDGDCIVTFFDKDGLRYRSTKTNKQINVQESARIERRSEQSDREVSDFITDVVIPSMFAHMGGKTGQLSPQKPFSESEIITRQPQQSQQQSSESGIVTDQPQQQKIQNIEDIQNVEQELISTRVRLIELNKKFFKTPKDYKEMVELVKKVTSLQKELKELKNPQSVNMKSSKVPIGKKEAKEEYKKTVKEAKEILEQRLKAEDREGKKEAKKEYEETIKEAKEILEQRLKGKSVPTKEEIQKEEANKSFEAEAQDREIALSSPNSFDMANSVSDFIFQTITKESKKSDQYKTDEERFSNLKDKEEILKYISSITTNVASFPDENNETAVFYCRRVEGSDAALLLFLDGKCIGMGTKNKGLLTKIPKSAGIHTLSLRDKTKELLNIPVDYSFKTYYPFEWNNNTINLTTVSTEKADNNNNTPVASSSNSYDIANSVSDLILQAITKESKKSDQYKTDEERFSQLKDRKQILDYIASVTSNVAGSPQEIENNVVFFCEGAKGSDLALLLFLDGKCIGIGTKNKGLFTQMPKVSGIRTLSLWSNDKGILNTPVNFSFKTYYPFEWERNVVKLKN
ncbi:MAG: hypothetical protein LBT50_04255 [Prevotellaceae bacterium]|jgi:hypothetical protein|nr:hypothetical protein [Prevotellaceae bacterium]